MIWEILRYILLVFVILGNGFYLLYKYEERRRKRKDQKRKDRELG